MSVVRKIQLKGVVEWQIQHEAKPSAVFVTRPHPRAVFYRTTRVCGALTDLLFCMGRLINLFNLPWIHKEIR